VLVLATATVVVVAGLCSTDGSAAAAAHAVLAGTHTAVTHLAASHMTGCHAAAPRVGPGKKPTAEQMPSAVPASCHPTVASVLLQCCWQSAQKQASSCPPLLVVLQRFRLAKWSASNWRNHRWYCMFSVPDSSKGKHEHGHNSTVNASCCKYIKCTQHLFWPLHPQDNSCGWCKETRYKRCSGIMQKVLKLNKLQSCCCLLVH